MTYPHFSMGYVWIKDHLHTRATRTWTSQAVANYDSVVEGEKIVQTAINTCAAAAAAA